MVRGPFGVIDTEKWKRKKRLRNGLEIDPRELDGDEVFDMIVKTLRHREDEIYEESQRSPSHDTYCRFSYGDMVIEDSNSMIYYVYTRNTGGYCSGKTEDIETTVYTIPIGNGVLIWYKEYCHGLNDPYGTEVDITLKYYRINPDRYALYKKMGVL